MSNQIVITSGAKVRELNDVIIGTSGVLSSLAFNVANGVPKLDSNAKILVSQLPNSVMEYQGTWNANTNTPTLTNGGAFNQGDVYLCNVAGTTDFGAGPIAFIVGDSAIYSGSIWQRSGGATGSVTSVGLSTDGNAITIGSSPITTSGTITANFAGTSGQYINGAGNLTTFPTLLSSVGLSMPSAFSVANSPLTANGTIAVTGAGYPSQYIRGDGTLADFPTSGGGGSSVSYYLNGGTSQGTIGGVTYYEMSKTADTGTGVDFPKSGDGLIVSFLTDAGDPAQLNIPAGNWNYEIYASMSSNGGTPQMYAELYVYNGTTFTLISTSSNEILYDGVNLNLYTFAMTVPATTLALTDRLAIKLYSTNSGGKTTTVHTQDSHLCQVITTFSTGITALNGLTAQVQYFATGTSGTDFNISSSTATHTFNIPDASATARGLITTGTQTIAGSKTFTDIVNSDSGILLKNGVIPNATSSYVGLGSNGAGITITTKPSATVYNNNFYFPASSNTYTFPSATGTIALTSNLSSYVPTSRQLTINGTAYDLSADRTWSVGTVTSVAALTLGTTGTDLSSTVATGTTTPVITLNVPTASATNRGALSSTDWSTFNSKESALTFSSPLVRTTNTISIPAATTSVNGYLTSTDWTTFNSKANALSGTINTIAYWNSSTTISSLALATYPSLTELSYVKGVTSAIQTQLDAKQATITLTTTGTSGAATLVGATLNIPNYADGGVLSLSAIGSTPNANAATITGTVLNLQPASASFGGVVTTGTQTIAGIKTFSGSTTYISGNLDITGIGRVAEIYFGTTADIAANDYIGQSYNSGKLHFYNGYGGLDLFSITRSTGLAKFASGIHTTSVQINSDAGIFFDYGAYTNSRTWRIANDIDAYGDFQILQSTTQTGSTYSKILGFSPTGVATFSSSIAATSATFSNTLTVSMANYPQLILNSTNSNGPILKFQEGGVDKALIGHITQITGLQFSGNGSTAQATLDSSGNLGLGVTPSAWSQRTAIQLANGVSLSAYNASTAPNMHISSNAYYNGTNWIYVVATYKPTLYEQNSNGDFIWSTAAAGTIGNSITFTPRLTIASTGAATFSSSVTAGQGTFAVSSGLNLILEKSTGAYLSFQNGATIRGSINGNNGTDGINLNYGASHTTALSIGSTGAATFYPASSGGGVTIGSTTTAYAIGLNFINDANTNGNVIGLVRTANQYITGTAAGDMVIGVATGKNIIFGNSQTGSTKYLTIASTGEATFSSLGTGTVTATSGTLSTVSDMNLKVEDGYINNALDKVMNLKPRYYHWKKESGLPTDLRQLGFYAQEVNEALGEEAANTPKTENDKWGIYDRGMIAFLTAAIQEMNTKFEEQQAIITSLQDRLYKLENK